MVRFMRLLVLVLLSSFIPCAARGEAGPATEPQVDVQACVHRDSGTFLKADTLVRIQILDFLSSKTTRKGETFRLKVLNSIDYDGTCLVAAGATGTGQVVGVRRRGGFGRKGRLDLRFGFVKTVGSRQVDLTLSRKAVSANHQEGYAAGASVTGAMILGPIGLAGGAFIKGRDVEIPAQATLWVAVEKDVDVTDEIPLQLSVR